MSGNEALKPVDILLFCPNCAEQHIDEAEPDVCQDCGHDKKHHFSFCNRPDCRCENFTAWLNPPHKSHRCHFCNHVWRPSDVPTNGVRQIKTKGGNDGNFRPRYFKTAKDFQDALND